jgi:tetratricopeptide (TPR) repeat protein
MSPVSRKEIRRWTKQIRELERSGQTEAVLESGRALAARHAESADARIAVGQLYLRLGDSERAAGEFRRAWALVPLTRRWKIAASVVRGLGSAGREGEALDLLRPLDPVMAAGPLAVERAWLLRRLGRPEEACAELSRGLDAEPYCPPAWEELLDLLEELGRDEEAAAARRRRDAVPRKLSATEVVETINAAFPDDSGLYVVNIGCRDGKVKDPCYELYQRGHPGLAIDAGDFPRLHSNLPQPEVRKLLNTTLTPDNVADVLRGEDCPDRPALLKIDVDGFDGPLLEAALNAIEPDVIRIEVNPDFPPPLSFAVEYDPDYVHSGTAGFFGCSLSYVLSVCRPRGYELLQVDFSRPTRGQDAMLVKEQYLPIWGVESPVGERDLFLREPYGGWRGLVEIGVDTRAWRPRTDFDALLSEAREACMAASRYRSGRVLPFLLDLWPAHSSSEGR